MYVFPPNAPSASNMKKYLGDTLGTFVDEFIFHYVNTVAPLKYEIENPTPEGEGNSLAETTVSLAMHMLC